MKIVYLSAGAAGMYCGTCLHDNTLAAALLELGEDVLLVPTYTPLRTDEEDISLPRVFYGGINVFLQQKSALFRHTPWWLDGLWDRPSLLKRASRSAGIINPAGLGELTVSMLQGEAGRQKKELDKLVHWLAHDVRPDIVHLSNAMLLGMTRELRRRLDVPVVCALSGEDIFLERIPQPYYQQARALLRQRARDVAAFTALNRYYADAMVEYLSIDRERIEVIPHGLKLAGHGERSPRAADQAFTIGYLARICHDKGLHLLAEAFGLLAKEAGLPTLRLKVAGYLAPGDRPYLAEIERRLAAEGIREKYQYVGELDRSEKIAFLQSLDVMALPTVYRESKGLSVLEAWANGVPTVLPDHGTFPELVADTGGGLLCEAGNARSLAERLAELARAPELAARLGQQGQQAVRDRYHAERMARRTRDFYARVLDQRAG